MKQLLLITQVLVVHVIKSIDCTVCYDCHGVTEDAICTRNITCTGLQSCYKSVTQVNGSPMKTLGCIDNQQCSSSTGGNIIVGRSIGKRQQPSCIECCSTDMCNDQLCHHTKPTACVDDETIDCAKLNSLFAICSDINHAKITCPNFCGLCNVVDGQWSDWSQWTNCDVTCENGTQTRYRSCSNPAPAHGGSDCTGSNKDTRSCFKASMCPVHGGWSSWQSWDPCSTTCDSGIQSRIRTCTNPTPEYSGHYCLGKNFESRLCNTGPCADGGWSTWSSWTDCSIPNGKDVGVRTKSRTCTNPAPSLTGKYCVGDSIMVGTCAVYSDCSEIKHQVPTSPDGIYSLKLWNTSRTIQVYCDMTTDGGGWTVFQKRVDGSVDFYRNYSEYVHGFGDLHTEFWLGLDFIEELSSHDTNELRIDLVSSNGTTAFEVLSHFYLTKPEYVLHVGSTTSSHNINFHKSDFGPGHNGHPFSTFDHDVDSASSNCASKYHGAWWYSACHYANLNGQYLPPGTTGEGKGMIYHSFIFNQSLKQSRMAFRRVN